MQEKNREVHINGMTYHVISKYNGTVELRELIKRLIEKDLESR